jgi:4-amino-4-deoxy-L-arabinose transferase-like glycosyltransferase
VPIEFKFLLATLAFGLSCAWCYKELRRQSWYECDVLMAAFVVTLLLTLVFGGLGLYSALPSTKQEARQVEEQRQQEKQPQVVSEVDGCTVYRFYDGRFHYFTRCGCYPTRTDASLPGKGNKTETISVEPKR